IKDYKQSQKIQLDRNKDYWQGKPKLDHVNVTYQEDGNARTSDLDSGKADVITDVPVEKVKSLKESDKTKISSVSGFRTGLLLYNHTSDKMTKQVREALDKVIDRKRSTDNVSKGYATSATGPFNNKLDSIENKDVQKQNIAQAKKIMKDAGYSEAHPLKLMITRYNGSLELTRIAQLIQSGAKKTNINNKLRNVDDIQGYLRDKKHWDALLYRFRTI